MYSQSIQLEIRSMLSYSNNNNDDDDSTSEQQDV